MQRVDLTGKIFGDLTVLKYLGNKRYLCKCSCGNTKEVATYSLTSGAVTSCGCKSSRLKYDITNQRFGKLTALRFVGNGKWLCQCDCGKQVEILTNRLITGQTTSCGHSQAYELIGKIYGEWEVIGVGTIRDKVLCKCSCGVTREVDTYNLKNGTTKSCGHDTNEFKDLTGKIFGELQVLKYNDTTKKYICKCSCGSITEVRGHDLRSGNTKSCGHASNNFKDLTGQKFNEWTVLHRTQGYMWMCRCSCGVEKEVASYSLRNGTSKSCGHTKLKNKTNDIGKKTREIKDLTGQKFGEWQVIKRDETKQRYWICKCSCGVEKSIQDYSLTSGRSKSCGHSKLEIDFEGIDKSKLLDRGKKFGIYLGQRFGEWEVIGDVEDYKVPCICSCGKSRSINIYMLKSGESTSCGHTMNKDRIIDISGKQFGDLTPIKYIANGVWECRCICGNIVKKQISHLMDGRARSCGHNNIKLIDLSGERFGRLTVLEYVGHKTWKCKCDCGNVKNILGVNLRNGSTISCGCAQNSFTRDELVEKILEYKDKNEVNPTIYELAKYLNMEYSTMRYHIQKYDLNHSQYMDMSYTSVGEKEVFQYINGIYNGDIKRSVKNIINPYELDIYMPELGIAIEFNGNYWHSSIIKDKEYHLNKTKLCGKKHIRLVHIFEYEWNDSNKRNKIKQFLYSLICNNAVIEAEKLGIKEVSNEDAVEFCNKYHLKNGINSEINIGLYKENELISIMTLAKPSIDTEYQYEILRMVSKPYIRIDGWANRLFKYFLEKYKPLSVVAYCDLAKSYGSDYIKMGFKFSGWDSVHENYIWWKDGSVLYGYQTTKERLIEAGYEIFGDTEDEIMLNLGYIKIYDCGNLRFTWNK